MIVPKAIAPALTSFLGQSVVNRYSSYSLHLNSFGGDGIVCTRQLHFAFNLGKDNRTLNASPRVGAFLPANQIVSSGVGLYLSCRKPLGTAANVTLSNQC
ncbi:MAG TPA: hypothetical protein V6C95_22330 [Coleofasciculaceae cyanobacterium]